MKILFALSLFVFPLFLEGADLVNNSLLEKWQGPYQGVPAFDKVKVSEFKTAIEQSINEQRAEINAITKNSEPPNFANTVEAYERSGQTYARVATIFDVWQSSMSTPDFKLVEKEMRPKMSAFDDEVYQNSELFKRIDAVYNSPDKAKLTPEQQRLVWYHWTKFVLNGARLTPDQKSKVAVINQRLATLQTEFSQNLTSDEEDEFLLLENEKDLEGLPQSFIDSAAVAAEAHKQKGKWIVENSRSAMEPFLTYSTRRDLREKAFRIFISRGDNNNAHNNNKIVTEILKLRAERSKLLGFKSYAHWHLADSMAKDPKIAMNLMLKVWKPAVKQVKKEVADMQKIVDAEKGGFKIAPWDYRYYAEKVRKAKYDLDFDIVKPYLDLENIRKGMFWAAGELYGFKFVPVSGGVPVFAPTVSVYEVQNAKGKLVGLWYFDPYARPGKRSGAWMNSFRAQYRENETEIIPIVSNNSNFSPGKPGEPVLISWDDAVTMLHEFGHAIHGLNSDVTYQSLSGTNVVRDFVEFPSQLNENYLTTPEVLKFLVNKKGQVLPQELIKKIDQAKSFNSGFDTVEFLSSAIVDMKLHLVTDHDIDPKSFEETTLKSLGMPSEIVMRHRIPQFGHLFNDEGYAAGYYGYLWSQVLDYDAFEAFNEAGGPYNAKTAKCYHDLILSKGNTVDPAVSYRKFRGRNPKADALLRARGFPLR